ncbi:hypothetical protein HA397_25760, partial [Escherichia coli]|nr:hypothetical protein [Escherichia coli]
MIERIARLAKGPTQGMASSQPDTSRGRRSVVGAFSGGPAAPGDLNTAQRIMASPVGEALARSWLDWVILQSLKRLFFPFSRLWGAARAANGEVETFAAAAPLSRPV